MRWWGRWEMEGMGREIEGEEGVVGGEKMEGGGGVGVGEGIA